MKNGREIWWKEHWTPVLGIPGVLGLLILVVINPSWFEDRNAVVQAAAMVAIVIVTAAYAYHTHCIARETRGQAVATDRLAEKATEQAEASRRMAEEMERGKSYAVHPFLTIIPKPGILERSGWMSDVPIDLNSVRVVNDGLGPALNGELLFKAKDKIFGRVGIPPLKPGIGYRLPVPKDLEGSENSSAKDWKSISQLLVSYEDLFKYRHETSAELEHDGGGSYTFRIKEIEHRCFGRDGEEKESRS